VAISVSGESLRRLDRDNGQSGILTPTANLGAYGGSALTALTANRKYGSRVVPSRRMTITTVGICVTTVEGSSGNSAIDVGIFDSTGQTLISSSGPQTGVVNGLGWHHLTLAAPVTLSEGVTYYAGLAAAAAFTGTAAQLFGIVPATNAPIAFGSTLGVLEFGFLAAAGGTLAAPLGLNVAGFVPVFALREA
jgi:hypothetical protein